MEECEAITVSTIWGNVADRGFTFEHTRGGRGGQRTWFRCPRCGGRMFKLYRPPGSAFFACRQCHNLTYRSVQEHDARLDRLVNAPDWLLMSYARNDDESSGICETGIVSKY